MIYIYIYIYIYICTYICVYINISRLLKKLHRVTWSYLACNNDKGMNSAPMCTQGNMHISHLCLCFFALDANPAQRLLSWHWEPTVLLSVRVPLSAVHISKAL